jgi:hypothetical protein
VRETNRKTLVVLLLALASLIVAGVFAPQTGTAPRQAAVHVREEVAGWLWRLAALPTTEGAAPGTPRSGTLQPVLPNGL